jgi:hypothetical protein
MIEDALREAFKAKAGSPPLTSLDGIADVAIRNAGRVRRRRRTAVTGFAAFIVVAVAAVTTFQVLGQAGPADSIAQQDTTVPFAEPQGTAGTQTAPPAAPREVPAFDGQAQSSNAVRLKLPDNGSSVVAAYKAKDGYLVVNTEADGDKQLVLQDDHDKQQVLVPKASDITVAKGGDKVAWAEEGKVTVASRTTSDDKSKKQQLTGQVSTEVPDATVPVAFVGADLVLGREEGAGYDVWYAGRDYTEAWDAKVVRIFGVHQETKSIYAEVKPAEKDAPMCLALLTLDQPFKESKRRCGLPVAAKAGGRVSPDGHWLAYPVEGLKQVAMLDLTKVFDGATAAVTWTLQVTMKTVWMNATTFVVESTGKFLAISTTGAAGASEQLEGKSDGVVLVEPL